MKDYSLFPSKSAMKPIRTPKVGDVLVSTWGYDQTNADFYVVIKVGAKTVELAQASNVETPVPNSGGMYGEAVPNVEHLGPAFLKKVKQEVEGYSVKMHSYSSAYLWSGKPVSVSHTA